MALFKILRGPSTALGEQNKVDGYCYFTPDTRMFYIDYTDGDNGLVRKPLNADDARTLLGKGVVEELLNDADNVPTAKAVFEYAEEVKADLNAEIAKKMDKENQTIEAFNDNTYAAIGAGTTGEGYDIYGLLVRDQDGQVRISPRDIEIDNFNNVNQNLRIVPGGLEINDDHEFADIGAGQITLKCDDDIIYIDPLGINSESEEGSYEITPEHIRLNRSDSGVDFNIVADLGASGLYVAESDWESGIKLGANHEASLYWADSEGAHELFIKTDGAYYNDKKLATIDVVTATSNGLMTSADKTKLDGLATVATSGSYNDLAHKPTIPTTAADIGAVPTTRKINNKALSDDITLSAEDVGALPVLDPEITTTNSIYVGGDYEIIASPSEGLSVYNTNAGLRDEAAGLVIRGSEISFDSDGLGNPCGIIRGLGDPTEDDHAATKGYVDSKIVDTSSFMSATNPTGTGSFSLNRLSGPPVGNYSFAVGWEPEASGECSHAEGEQVIASGNASHAEGSDTSAEAYAAHAEGSGSTASGEGSHAEGVNTVASGRNSHAEGGDAKTSTGSYTAKQFTLPSGETLTVYGPNAVGNNSHAEGCQTLAYGYSSHAEGCQTAALRPYTHTEGISTIASGHGSHAEGATTTASGNYSHAEGSNTKASSEYQHAQGKFNVEDSAGAYAHIVGNGSSNTARSNAHTLDWSGNAWYAGNMLLGADDGSGALLRLNGVQTAYNSGSQIVLSSNNIPTQICGSTITATKSITTSSDERLKENIAPVDISACIEFIKGLNVKTFNYIGNEDPYIGVVAQDVNKLNPELAKRIVSETPDGYYSVKISDLVFPLISMVQYLSEEVEKLKSNNTEN